MTRAKRGAPASALLLLAACHVASQPAGSAPPRPTSTPAPVVTAPAPAAPESSPLAAAVPEQPSAPAAPRNEAYLEILKLQGEGASEEALLQRVRSSGVRYELTTAQILELRQAGVPESVVTAMLRSGP